VRFRSAFLSVACCDGEVFLQQQGAVYSDRLRALLASSAISPSKSDLEIRKLVAANRARTDGRSTSRAMEAARRTPTVPTPAQISIPPTGSRLTRNSGRSQRLAIRVRCRWRCGCPS